MAAPMGAKETSEIGTTPFSSSVVMLFLILFHCLCLVHSPFCQVASSA